MNEILHAFGAGIAFSVGVVVGAILCRIVTKEGRKEFGEEWRTHREAVESRLTKYAANSDRIATAIEAYVKQGKP